MDFVKSRYVMADKHGFPRDLCDIIINLNESIDLLPGESKIPVLWPFIQIYATKYLDCSALQSFRNLFFNFDNISKDLIDNYLKLNNNNATPSKDIMNEFIKPLIKKLIDSEKRYIPPSNITRHGLDYILDNELDYFFE